VAFGTAWNKKMFFFGNYISAPWQDATFYISNFFDPTTQSWREKKISYGCTDAWNVDF
jgi:hypothetical protein